MKRLKLPGLALVALLSLPSAYCAVQAVAPAARIELFNSTNLAGWYSWLVDSRYQDPRRVFSVIDRQIRISGDGLGYLGTSNQFRDYVLELDFRWGANNTRWGDRIGKARDSGVFLHATGHDGNSHDGNGAFMAAIECNVFQGATGDFLLIRGNTADGKLIAPRVTFESRPTRDRDGWPWWQRGGARTTLERWGRVNWRNKSGNWRDELNFRGLEDVEKPYGEWNHLEITCKGDNIVVKLNGVQVNEAFDVWPREGRILLQCEGSEIFFRRVLLSPVKGRR